MENKETMEMEFVENIPQIHFQITTLRREIPVLINTGPIPAIACIQRDIWTSECARKDKLAKTADLGQVTLFFGESRVSPIP